MLVLYVHFKIHELLIINKTFSLYVNTICKIFKLYISSILIISKLDILTAYAIFTVSLILI